MKFTPDLRAARMVPSVILSAMLVMAPVIAVASTSGRVVPVLSVPTKPAENPMLGTWEIERKVEEKGADRTETTVLQFLADGTYKSWVKNSLFPDQDKQQLMHGRYAVSDHNSKGFALSLRAAAADPDAGKELWPEQVRVDQISADTLRGPDGSVIKRVK